MSSSIEPKTIQLKKPPKQLQNIHYIDNPAALKMKVSVLQHNQQHRRAL
jgi:hypothetical protein